MRARANSHFNSGAANADARASTSDGNQATHCDGSPSYRCTNYGSYNRSNCRDSNYG